MTVRAFMRLLVVVLCGLLAPPVWSQSPARDSSEGILLDQSRKLNFKPVEAFFLVAFDDQRTVRVPAMMLTDVPGSEPREDAFVLRSAGVRIIPPPGARRITFSTVFVGAGTRLEFAPPETVELTDPRVAGRSTDALREELLQRKAVLGSWRMQIQAQDESLRRLRADAEIIGEFGRIIDKKEEIEKARADSASVRKDIENLEHFLKLAKTRPAPANQVGREASLVAQVSEITQVSHAVEMTEMRRKAGAEADLQRKLAVIEATRLDDLGALESERAKLQQDYEALRQRQGGAP